MLSQVVAMVFLRGFSVIPVASKVVASQLLRKLRWPVGCYGVVWLLLQVSWLLWLQEVEQCNFKCLEYC